MAHLHPTDLFPLTFPPTPTHSSSQVILLHTAHAQCLYNNAQPPHVQTVQYWRHLVPLPLGATIFPAFAAPAAVVSMAMHVSGHKQAVKKLFCLPVHQRRHDNCSQTRDDCLLMFKQASTLPLCPSFPLDAIFALGLLLLMRRRACVRANWNKKEGKNKRNKTANEIRTSRE